MRRLLYFLLGSTLFHGALLWVPFPMSAGGARENVPRVVRVRLVDPPRTEATKPTGRTESAAKVKPAKAARPATPTQPRVEPRSRTPVVKAPAQTPSPVDSEPGQVKTVAKKPPKRVRPEPARPRRTETAAMAAENPRITTAGVTARKPARRDGSGEKPQLARGVAPAASAGGDIQTTVDLSPVRYARTVKPRYPRKARRAGWEGTTVLKVRVDPDGAPDRVMVDRTSGFDILDAAAVKAVQRWRFHPARRGIEALSSWVRVPVAFKLKENR